MTPPAGPLRFSGTLRPGAPDWAYLPVEVPAGVGELAVRYAYDRPGTPPGVAGNALDIGLFDERGVGAGGAAGFRGWSGGARDRFAVGPSGATPGYLPGPVNPGTWHVVLGPYTVAPQGMRWSVEVALRSEPAAPDPVPQPDPAPERVEGRGRGWYRGDLHLHSVHSDGRRTLAELAGEALAGGLDFIASTEHNTSSANLRWGRHAGPGLLVLPGQEVTTRSGHWLALGLPPGGWVDWRYRAGDPDFERAVGELRAAGGLAVAAHPFCPYPGCAWEFGYEGVDAVEVWNGPWTADDEAALATWDRTLAGHRFLPGVANSDTHDGRDRVGRPQNVVLAARLGRRALLGAVRRGRLFMAESAAVDLRLRATAGGRSAGIGGRLEVPPGQELVVRLRVRGAGGGLARLVDRTGPVLEARLPGGGRTGTVQWRTTTAAASAYVRAEVRRAEPTATTPDTVVALTNPVLLSGRPPA